MSEARPDQRGRADETELRAMVDRYSSELKAAGAIESAAVERAFRTVERHRLLETFYYRGAEGTRTLEHDPGHPRRDHLALIYADTVLATRHIDGRPASSTSQASLVARMLELLDLGEGMKILEVGAGTGYNAALHGTAGRPGARRRGRLPVLPRAARPPGVPRAGGPGAQRRPGRLGGPGARRDTVVEGRLPGPRARPPLPRVGRARPAGHRGLPDLVRAGRLRRRSAAGRMADRAAVLPRAADPGLSARTTIRSVERKGADLIWAL